MMNDDELYQKTENCIICLKTATHWNGLITRSRDKVLAGLCDEHKEHKIKGLFLYDKSIGIIYEEHTIEFETGTNTKES